LELRQPAASVLPYPSHDKINERGQKGVAHNKYDREIHCDSFPTLGLGVVQSTDQDSPVLVNPSHNFKRQACIGFSEGVSFPQGQVDGQKSGQW
jgi:hypothetical protein